MKSIIEIALSQYGVTEIVGNKHNPQILEYHKTTGGFSDDETAWCSSFINWCAIQAGLEHTSKANARSWLNVGENTTEPKIGDIVVFKRGTSSWQGHVGIYINKIGNTIYVLSGNQSNMVNISGYKESDLLGYKKLKVI
jgi:uncharacterized protein (TIGR02594 family)